MSKLSICKLRMISPGFVNYTYIIIDVHSRESVIVDPAWNLNKIEDAIQLYNLNLSAILLTHSHFDHTNLVNRLIKKYSSVNVFISKKEATYYNYDCPNLNMISDNDIIYFGEQTITCIDAPGHTIGSLIYKCQNNIFTGDSIFIEGCGYCKSKGGSSRQMFQTVQKIKSLPYDTIVWPGHAFKSQPGKNLKYVCDNNVYFMIEKVSDFIKFSDRRNKRDIFKFV